MSDRRATAGASSGSVPSPAAKGQAAAEEQKAGGEKKKKEKKKEMIKGELDFREVALEHGYIKARQMLRQSALAVHQNLITKTDAALFKANHMFRYKEAIRISNTLGEPSAESVIEKLDERSLAAVNIVPAVERGETAEQATKSFDMDVALRSAIKSKDLALVLPEYELEVLPPSMGDTLFLQTSFLQAVSLTNNFISSILNPALPQVSLYHLRYVKELNLMNNKLKSLPGDIGALYSLTSLNLSGNQLSTLPLSMTRLKRLRLLDLSSNSFATLMDELSLMDGLESIELVGNLFMAVPPPLVRMRKIKRINLMRNTVPHVAVQTVLNKPEDLWWPFVDDLTAERFFVNVLTREKVKSIATYEGKGIEKAKDLHTFQRKGTTGYRRRKFWLSVNQVHEWDDIEDQESGKTYYRNNVTGITKWDLPIELDTFGEAESLVSLNLACNAVKFFSKSMCTITSLVSIVAHTNKLKDLPDNFGDLINLEMLDLHNNDIKLLPRSFCACTNLVTLMLSGNQLIRLPDLLGTLPRLARVDAAGNRMTSVPFTLGYSKSLVDIKVSEFSSRCAHTIPRKPTIYFYIPFPAHSHSLTTHSLNQLYPPPSFSRALSSWRTRLWTRVRNKWPKGWTPSCGISAND